MKYIYFDIEVFKKDWLLITEIDNIQTVIVNDYEKLYKFFDNHKDDLWIGYNINQYDNLILKALLIGENPWEYNDLIINQKETSKVRQTLSRVNYYWKSFDLFNLGDPSLKQIMAMKGWPIIEADIEFDREGKLSKEEMENLIKYCKNDVKWLKEVHKIKHELELVSKTHLINEFNMSPNNIKMAIPKLVSELLVLYKREHKDDELYSWPKDINIKDREITKYYSGFLNSRSSLKKQLHGGELSFGLGGLHMKKRVLYDNKKQYLYFDVVSFYPWIMRNYDLLSKSVDEKRKQRFYDMIDYRMKYRGQKLNDEEKARDRTYKVVLNSVFGAMGSSYNKLYDQKNCYAVTITGQLLLWELIESIMSFCEIIYVNTDAIIVEFGNPLIEDMVKECVNSWCDKYNFRVDMKNPLWFSIKDTNNYIIKFEDEVVSKGKNFSRNDYLLKNKRYVNYSDTVIHNAILAYYLDGIKPEEYINNCNDPIKYQLIRKVGKMYSRAFWENDNKEVRINIGHNRFFSSKNLNHGRAYKCKIMGDGRVAKHKISELPNHVFVHNEGVECVNIDMIDKNYYIEEAKVGIDEFRK